MVNASDPLSIGNIEQELNSNMIYIYPNPAIESITIRCANYPLIAGYVLNITNSLGQTVYTGNINQQESFINCSSWTGKGIYFAQVIDVQKSIVEVKRIVLQ